MSDTGSEHTAVGDKESDKRVYSVHHPEVRTDAKATFQNLGKGLTLVTILFWVALPIFWGSSYLLLRYFHRLTVAVVDFDSIVSGQNAILGPALIRAAQETNAMNPNMPRLGYAILSASDFSNGVQGVRDNVMYGGYWGAIVALPNATSTWLTSLQNGNVSYDPTGSMQIMWSTARFYQITLIYLVEFMSQAAEMITKQASSTAVTGYLQANANNATALDLARAVPQAIGTGFSFFLDDVGQINAWSVAAIFEASLIYYLIFTFIFANWSHAGRAKTGLNRRLTFWSLYGYRLGVAIAYYIFISLFFTCIVKAFQIPTHAALGSAGGFFALWALNLVGLAALGLAIESFLSLLTPKFLAFFLWFWIVTNLTSSFTPIELTENFYRLLRAWPFYQMVYGYKIITHATERNSELGKYFGVLFAWIAVELIGLALFMAVERRRDDNAERQQISDRTQQEQRKLEKSKPNAQNA